MLIEAGRIVSLAEDRMWLDMESRRLRCAGCRGACGFSAAGRRCVAERRLCVPLPPDHAATLEIGQRVEVGLPTAPLLGATMWSYLAPLLGFLAALSLTTHWLPGGGEGLALAMGLLGLAAGAALARIACRRRLDEPPQLLRTLPDSEPASQSTQAHRSAPGEGRTAPLASDR